MFKNSFSFEGRIRRTEYGLSFIIYAVLRAILLLVIASGVSNPNNAEGAQVLFVVLSLPLFWFLLAQGAKRCHDAGFSGWWQLVPFCPLVLIFMNGEEGLNKYGENPKLDFVKVDY